MTEYSSLPTPDHLDDRPDPDRLLAAVPGLLGFVPERSLVLLAFADDRTVIATMRHDLDLRPGGGPTAGMRRLADRLGALASSYGAVGTVAVIIDDRRRLDDAGYAATASAVDRGFREAGGLSAAFAMSEAVAGASWRTIWRPRSGRDIPPPFGRGVRDAGILSDPNASPTALERALHSGRRILPRRSEMTDLLAAAGHCSDADCTPVWPAARDSQPNLADRSGLAFILAVLDRWEAGDTDLTCAETNRIAEALVSVHVRDALLGLSLTAMRATAEDLWRTLTRRLRGPSRAAAATLLGHLHYMAGEGAFASVAFQAAHDADAEYTLANLLDSALTSGMRPKDLGGLAELAFSISRRLGAPLPPAVFPAAG